jgi:large subunit ribosomal protein L35
MPRTGGKAKTRKAVAKRFKVTGTGKILRRKQGKRHLLQGKSRKRKRSLGKSAVVCAADHKRIMENLPFA